MGKRMIIHGANFSENAVNTEVDITSSLTLVNGWHGVLMEPDEEKAGLNPRFDVSSYKNMGYTKIKVITKVDGILAFLCGSADQSAGGGRYVSITQPASSYAPAGTYIRDIENEYGNYFGVNINLPTAGTLSDISDYMQVLVVE